MVILKQRPKQIAVSRKKNNNRQGDAEVSSTEKSIIKKICFLQIGIAFETF